MDVTRLRCPALQQRRGPPSAPSRSSCSSSHSRGSRTWSSLSWRVVPPLRRPGCAASALPVDTGAAPPTVQLKSQVLQLAGTQYGHDLDEAAKQKVVEAVQQLVAVGGPLADGQLVAAAAKLSGTVWRPVFTTSSGTSSGKFGPFITDTLQEFPASEPGVYYNCSSLGPVRARLRGRYWVGSDDKIELEFETLALSVFGLQVVKKEWPQGQMRGFWRVRFCDDQLRVFETNKGNLFVMRAAAGTH